MLIEGEPDVRSGEEVDVELNLGEEPMTIPAQVLRGPGGVFLRFSKATGNREDALRAVGLLPPPNSDSDTAPRPCPATVRRRPEWAPVWSE